MITSKILLPLISTGILLVSCGKDAKNQSSYSQATPIPKLPVDVRVVSSVPINHQEIIVGTIQPLREVSIASELLRKIVSISFKDGSYVNEGQVLYRLDDTDLQAQLRKIQAELRLALLNEKRLSQLLKSESVKQEEYDIAITKLQALQAEEEILKVSLDKTEIKAPFSGQIGITKYHEGALVSSSDPLVTLQDQSKVKVYFKVPERYLPLLQYGSQIEFTTEATTKKYSGEQKKFSATINAIEAKVDDDDRSILIQAVAVNDLKLFKSGQSANVYFSLTVKDAQGISLPTEAVIPTPKGYNVFVVKNGVAKIMAVKVGNRTETEALILDGIANGDTVMISNILRAGEGIPVQIASIQ